MTFQRVSTLKQWVIGSLESDTGSEFLFGFDPQEGLMWLERKGAEYGPGDAVWVEAENYIRTSGMMGNGPVSIPVEHDEESYTVQVSSGIERPERVSRSATGDGVEFPQVGDPRIVGDTTLSGRDVPDEDIAAEAARFLSDLGEEDYDGE